MPEAARIVRAGRFGHRVLGGVTLGLLALAMLDPHPDRATEALRLALWILLPLAVFAVLRLWRQNLPPGWVLLHLHLMLLGLLTALAAQRFGFAAAEWIAGALLLGGLAAGAMAGRRP